MKSVVLDGYTVNPGDLSWEPVSRLAPCQVYDRTAPSQTVERIGGAEIVFSNKVPLDEAVMAACPSLRYIGVLATGYNQVDLSAAARRGITVTNIPNYSTDAVAQFTFALLLELCHRTAHHDQAVRGPRGRECPDFCFWDYPQQELAGKTMGIVGFGAIGRRVARLAEAFGLRLLIYTPHPRRELEGGGLRFVSLEELLSQSDIVSLHCPLTGENEGMIDAAALARMKPSAILLNTARGRLVDEEALAVALNCGALAGAAVDVVRTEPARAETCPLFAAKNCMITPHIAWASRQARERLIQLAGDNLAAWLSGSPVNEVTP